ncbi:hypothetical protein [Eubacterium sp. 1001713B170207_170306_E7]|uniref:hypothetical protein n=1 Tax=Eubacterium sp. 1001713B170207_170306_E7 TaxID=2787097 RepID=UPI00189A3357|nr:hypothetical protein [Eubacterium sp. 1001713B170207_170306_E7]
MDNTSIYNFEEKWAEDIGLPKEVIQRIVNLSDLFEMISDQRLIPFKQHPGWFEGLQSIHRLNFDDGQIYMEALYDNDGMPPTTYDDEGNWIIPDPDEGQGRWEKYGQFFCSVNTNGEIYVNYFNFLDVSDLFKLEQKENAVLKCAKMSQVKNLKLKDIQSALYQYLCQKDPEDTFDYLNQSDNALYTELVDMDERYEVVDTSGEFLWKTVLELFENEKLHELFPEYDAIGYFEGNSPLQDLEWYEKAHYGKVVRYEAYGYVDLPVLEIDKTDPEYKAYRNELYQLAIRNACKNEDLSVYIVNHLPKDELNHVVSFAKEFNKNEPNLGNNLFDKKEDKTDRFTITLKEEGGEFQKNEETQEFNVLPVMDDER